MVRFFDATEVPGQSPPTMSWQDRSGVPSTSDSWAAVRGLEESQRRYLQKLQSHGVYWKNTTASASPSGVVFLLSHGGEVEPDGNCLFTSTSRAMGSGIAPSDLRRRAVTRFSLEYESACIGKRRIVDKIIRHLYSPDLTTGWGVHVVQEVKLLCRKVDREEIDDVIRELVDIGIKRETAARVIYTERCISVKDGKSWAKYMSLSGSADDEFDIISMHYAEEGLLSIDENRGGHAVAFGDDIAIESLATEFRREIYVIQAHGSDGLADEDNCVFFLPHRPRYQICEPPVFLFMKGTGWCGAGGDHYEPLIAHPLPFLSPEKAAVIL